MTFSEEISLLALMISAAGWYITYLLNRRNTVQAAAKARRLSRMDAAEALAFEIANKIAIHLMLPGSDSGRDGRIVALQVDHRRLLQILRECFTVVPGQQPQIPRAVSTSRLQLWEFGTGQASPDPARPAYSRDHVAITGALKAAANLVENARLKLP
jgi:hypothetical protein